MFPSICKLLTAAVVVSTAVSAMPQGGGYGGSGQGGQGGSGGYGGTGETTTTTNWNVATTTSASVAAASSGTATSTAAAASSTSTYACNNSPDLCNRKYSKIMHMGAHDSAFLRDSSTDNSIAGDQYYNATYALNAGLRLLQTQVHDSNGTLEMCHTTCSLLDGGSLESWLASIKYWMDDNPHEVVTLLLVNSDDMDVSDFGSVFESSNISTYGYTPSSATSWPTLQTMIDDGTRLVTFIASANSSSTYPYLLNEWDYVFETAYDVMSLDGFNCTLNRPTTYSAASSAISAGLLPLLNHMAYTSLTGSVYVPDVDDIDTTNSASTSTTGALGLHAKTCKSDYGMIPTFVLVDFFDQGPAIETADNMNDITATGRTNSSSIDASSSSSSDSSGAYLSRPSTGALIAILAAATLLI